MEATDLSIRDIETLLELPESERQERFDKIVDDTIELFKKLSKPEFEEYRKQNREYLLSLSQEKRNRVIDYTISKWKELARNKVENARKTRLRTKVRNDYSFRTDEQKQRDIESKKRRRLEGRRIEPAFPLLDFSNLETHSESPKRLKFSCNNRNDVDVDEENVITIDFNQKIYCYTINEMKEYYETARLISVDLVGKEKLEAVYYLPYLNLYVDIPKTFSKKAYTLVVTEARVKHINEDVYAMI